jgi:hypothetical protein
MKSKIGSWVVVYEEDGRRIFCHVRGKRDAKKLAQVKRGRLYTTEQAERVFGGAA